MGSHQELSRDRIKRRWYLLGQSERWLCHARCVLDSFDANRCGTAASVLAFQHTTAALWDLHTNGQWEGKERNKHSPILLHFCCYLSPLGVSLLCDHCWCWGHDDLSSLFMSLVLGQCVPTALPTADPPVCPCELSRKAALLFLLFFLSA